MRDNLIELNGHNLKVKKKITNAVEVEEDGDLLQPTEKNANLYGHYGKKEHGVSLNNANRTTIGFSFRITVY